MQTANEQAIKLAEVRVRSCAAHLEDDAYRRAIAMLAEGLTRGLALPRPREAKHAPLSMLGPDIVCPGT